MYPKGSLATHLSGGSYRNQMVEVPGASRSESKPDLKLALARPAPASSDSSRASKAKSQKLKKCKALLSSPTKATSAAKPPVVCVAPKGSLVSVLLARKANQASMVMITVRASTATLGTRTMIASSSETILKQ